RRLPYFFSKDEYLYTWVDLQPDGTVRSLYSGERKDPKMLIVQDVQTMKRRYDEFRQLLKKMKHGLGDVHERVKTIEQQWKFNAE
ncbi:endonuclease I, partial [Acinetobacter baumannii]